MHGSDLYLNELLFDRRTATGVRVPAPRAFEDTLIVCIALVDANIGTRHSGQSGRPFVISSAERPWPCSGILHLPQAEALRRLASNGLNETVSAAPAVVTAI
jgi:hypothetical protein